MATEANNLSFYHKETLPDVSGYRFALVVSQWNEEITSNLLKGALDTLLEQGVPEKQIDIFYVPGSFELVYGCKKAILTQKYDAAIAIGSVIQGETKHFDYVCQAATHGLSNLNVHYDTPVIFCVLTDQNKQQAIDRSGGKHGNKGVECAVTAMKMANFNHQF